MAIAKVGGTGSSAGAINYVLSENKEETKQPEILAGSFGTMAEIKQEFEAYNKQNPRIKNQATHISVSFSQGERVKTEKKIELAEKLLEKLDFKNVPYLVVEHFDKDYEHFHIIAGRIRDDGSTVKEWKIAERAIEATKVLEKEFGLKQVEYTKSNDRRVKTGEYKLMERTDELSVMAEAKLVIDEILKSRPHTRKFVESLQKSGFEVLPNLSESNGRMNGFSYKKDEIKFKSSSIAKNYSWKNLQKHGLDYDYSLDTEYLKGVKNEFTQKPNLESRRDSGIETPKSVIDRAKSGTGKSESSTSKTDRSEVESNRGQIDRYSHNDSITELNAIAPFSDSLETSRKFTPAEVSDNAVYESGHRRKSTTSEGKPRENSGVGKSTDFVTEDNVIFTEPKLNPALKRERERKASHVIEKDHSLGRSR